MLFANVELVRPVYLTAAGNNLGRCVLAVLASRLGIFARLAHGNRWDLLGLIQLTKSMDYLGEFRSSGRRGGLGGTQA